jgi:glycosyltransferase involved in cell wall biosynthesis
MWPAISEANPTTKFIIAGQRPVDAVKKLVTDRIEVTGFIPNLKDMYVDASVVIAPLRFGAGTQNKVLEAMAMGVPAVCTHIGFEGLQIQSGQGVIMAKEKSQFILEVNMLLSDAAKRQSVGEQGLEIAQTRFSWDKVAVQLEKYLKEIA